jgi:hypothetical protein
MVSTRQAASGKSDYYGFKKKRSGKFLCIYHTHDP